MKIGNLSPTSVYNEKATMFYNRCKQQFVVQNPSFSTTTAYDAMMRTQSVMDGRNWRKTYTYDRDSRMTGILYHDGSRVTYMYDPAGQMTTMVDNFGGTTENRYDVRGQMDGQTQPGGYVLTMLYDPVGNRTLLDSPAGAFTTTYDALDRTSVQTDPNGYATTAQYDPAGRRTTMVFGEGVQRKYQYDPADRLTTQLEETWGGTQRQLVVDMWDAANRKTSQTKNGTTTNYSYDAVDRLTSQQVSGGTATFAYNRVGDIQLKWHQGAQPMTLSYNLFGQLTTVLDGPTMITFQYDKGGNQTSEERGGIFTNYRYSQENQMIGVDHPDGTKSTYTYDGPGLRRSTHEPGEGVATFLWDGSDYLAEDK